MRWRSLAIAVSVGCTLGPTRTSAQSPVQPAAAATPHRVSVDFTVGPSAVRGGRDSYTNDWGAATEVLVGFRRPARSGLMGAVAAGVRGDVGQSCYVRLPANPPYGCIPHAPTIRHLVLLTGYEYRRGGSSVRAFLGPAAYTVNGRAGAGGQARASAAVGTSHFAVTAGVSGNWLTQFSGTPLRYYAAAFGLRIQ